MVAASTGAPATGAQPRLSTVSCTATPAFKGQAESRERAATPKGAKRLISCFELVFLCVRGSYRFEDLPELREVEKVLAAVVHGDAPAENPSQGRERAAFTPEKQL
jgi:hypothetical protein